MFRSMMRAAFGVVALALVAGAAGCGSPPDPSTAQNFITCATESRAVPYTPGISVTSDGRVFTVKLLSSMPATPVRGQNEWLVEIDEAASGAPLSDLEITVTPWMPDHLHGTRPVVVTPGNDPGTYRLKPVYLYMSGLWQIQFSIVAPTVGAGTIDTAQIPLCIS